MSSFSTPDPSPDSFLMPPEETLGEVTFTPDYVALVFRLRALGERIEALQDSAESADEEILSTAKEAIGAVSSSHNYLVDPELTGLKMQFLMDGGSALVNLGRFSEAKIFYEDAERLVADDASFFGGYLQDILCCLGAVHRELGAIEAAIDCFTRAAQLEGESALEARSEIVITLCAHGETLLVERGESAARTAFEAASKVGGDLSSEAHEALASAMFQSGDIALAADDPSAAYECYRASVENARRSQSMPSSHVRSLEVEAAECFLRAGKIPYGTNFVRPLCELARRVNWEVPLDEYEHFVRAAVIFAIILYRIGDIPRARELVGAVSRAVQDRINTDLFTQNDLPVPIPEYFLKSFEEALGEAFDREGRRAAHFLREYAV